MSKSCWSRRSGVRRSAIPEIAALIANPDTIVLPIEQIEEACVFVAECDDVVGFTVIMSRSDGGAELDALFVAPHLWKHGIGRRLVDHVAGVARSKAATFLHVVGIPDAEASTCLAASA